MPKPSPAGLMTLQAIQLRVSSATRGGVPLSQMRQAQALNVDSIKRLQFVLGADHKFVNEANKADRVLASAIAEAEGRSEAAKPPRHITTVGDLKALLAGLPNSTRLDEIPLVDPKWSAAAAQALAMVPPLQKIPEGRRANDRPFGSYGLATAEEVLDQ